MCIIGITFKNSKNFTQFYSDELITLILYLIRILKLLSSTEFCKIVGQG